MAIAFPWWRAFLYKWRSWTVCARCEVVAVFISHLSRKPDPKSDRLRCIWARHPWRLGGLVPSPVRCADLLRAEHGMGVLVSFYCYALAFHRLAFACYPYRLGLASYTVANVYLSACHLPTACVLPAFAWLLDLWAFLVLAHPPRVPAPLPNMYHNIIKNSAAQVVTSTAPMFRRVVVGVGYRLLENITVKNRACRI